jgi:hypothetical protein
MSAARIKGFSLPKAATVLRRCCFVGMRGLVKVTRKPQNLVPAACDLFVGRVRIEISANFFVGTFTPGCLAVRCGPYCGVRASLRTRPGVDLFLHEGVSAGAR